MPQDGARPSHICSRTGARPCHICAGTGLTPIHRPIHCVSRGARRQAEHFLPDENHYRGTIHRVEAEEGNLLHAASMHASGFAEASTGRVCDSSAEIAVECDDCGDLVKCQALCNANPTCAYITYFEGFLTRDGQYTHAEQVEREAETLEARAGCRLFSACAHTTQAAGGVVFKRSPAGSGGTGGRNGGGSAPGAQSVTFGATTSGLSAVAASRRTTTCLRNRTITTVDNMAQVRPQRLSACVRAFVPRERVPCCRPSLPSARACPLAPSAPAVPFSSAPLCSRARSLSTSVRSFAHSLPHARARAGGSRTGDHPAQSFRNGAAAGWSWFRTQRSGRAAARRAGERAGGRTDATQARTSLARAGVGSPGGERGFGPRWASEAAHDAPACVHRVRGVRGRPCRSLLVHLLPGLRRRRRQSTRSAPSRTRWAQTRPAQMWNRCGNRPGADVGGASPVPSQMWEG